jgi:hypothetical protein
LAEEPFRAGRFFASGPLWNATARLWNTTLTAPSAGFRAKNRGVKQFLNDKICPKRLKNIA